MGKRRIATSIPAFKKDIPRKPMHKPSITQNENYFDYDYYAKENNQKSTMFSRIKPADMKNALAREYQGKEEGLKGLPTFMQKHIASRISITHLNHKMLETNCYEKGRF